MKEFGVEWIREMFEVLMMYYVKKGNIIRVVVLGEEMISEGIEVGLNFFFKLVDVSVEEGFFEKVERVFKDFLDVGYIVDVFVYIFLMFVYGKIGEYVEVLMKFEVMEEVGIKLNVWVFDIIILIMVNVG